MNKTGADRLAYSREVEVNPSRFANGGRDYAEWAARADAWARRRDEANGDVCVCGETRWKHRPDCVSAVDGTVCEAFTARIEAAVVAAILKGTKK